VARQLYDPDVAPSPDEWLALDESERTTLIAAYHEQAGIDLPNARFHAVLHTIIENQIAMGDQVPVAATVKRLVEEGLSRHEAIHCLMQTMAEHMKAILASPNARGANDRYYAKVQALTAYDWLNRGDPDEPPPVRPKPKRLRFRP